MNDVYMITYYLEAGDLGGFSSSHTCLIDETNKVNIMRSVAHTLNGDLDVTGLLTRSAIDDIEDLAIDQRARVKRVLAQVEEIGAS